MLGNDGKRIKNEEADSYIVSVRTEQAGSEMRFRGL